METCLCEKPTVANNEIILQLADDVKYQHPIIRKAAKRIHDLKELNLVSKTVPSYYNNGAPSIGGGW